MIDFDKFLRNILKDLQVELHEQFDRNFENKSYFGVPWAPVKRDFGKGSLMIRTGDLRRSIQSNIVGNKITFTSSLPYASIHNEGGSITVTPKMKRYFWAKYYEASGSITTKKNGQASSSKRNVALSEEAAYWKLLALMKIGSKITIPQRQYLGHHPQIDVIVHDIVDENVQQLALSITNMLRKAGGSHTK